MKLIVENLTKSFDFGKPIFKDISFQLTTGAALAVTGRNGSGKSTLLKIIAGAINPTKGKIEFEQNGVHVEREKTQNYFSYIAPYLILYEEFSPREHFKITSLFRDDIDSTVAKERFRDLMQEFAILKAIDKEIRLFSSGMKQRVKFVLELTALKPILILDEPFTNLDTEGIRVVEKYMKDHIKNNGILVVASNDEREYQFCNQKIELN